LADVELDFEGPILELQRKIEELESFAESTEMDLRGQIEQLRSRCAELQREVVAKLSPWERIQLARHQGRPLFSDYLSALFEDDIELHGDQHAGDDAAIYTGLATFRGRSVLLVGHRKGKNTKDRIATNFGSAHPEGYRKALHKMRLAEKFRLPVVALIDTPGAYPGVTAEERGQAHAIARNILEMCRLRTPVVCVVIGEGGSGGALGIGVGDRVLMLENAYYSVISPEGCSSILWKSGDFAARAAEILRLTANDLLTFKVVDGVVPEPLGGAHKSIPETCKNLGDAVQKALDEIVDLPLDTLLAQRYEKVRALGVFFENGERVGPVLPAAEAFKAERAAAKAAEAAAPAPPPAEEAEPEAEPAEAKSEEPAS
jgi:acetyl-CoA carboxylase carboxyl transferase subunit alpha